MNSSRRDFLKAGALGSAALLIRIPLPASGPDAAGNVRRAVAALGHHQGH